MQRVVTVVPQQALQILAKEVLSGKLTPTTFVLSEFFAVHDGGNYPGAQLYLYKPGTKEFMTVYADQNGTVEHAIPVVCDYRGWADVFVDGDFDWRFVSAFGVIISMKESPQAA